MYTHLLTVHHTHTSTRTTNGHTLKECSNRTRKGKLTACRMRFSFSVCSICLSFTTWHTHTQTREIVSTNATRSIHIKDTAVMGVSQDSMAQRHFTFCLSRIFMAKCWLVSLCRTSITRPNEPVPRVFNRSNWSRAAVFCEARKKKKQKRQNRVQNSDNNPF